MSYGLFGGFAEGFGAGANIRMKQDALEDEKKTNQLRRDSLELEIRKKRDDMEVAARNRDADDYLADGLERIRSAAIKGDFAGLQIPEFADFRASRKPKEQPKQQPEPTGIAGLVAGLRRGIAPAQAEEGGGIAAPAEAPAAPQGGGIQSPGAEEPKPSHNPFLPVGYKDPDVMAQRIRLQQQMLERYYNLKGQPEKALEVPAKMKALLKDNWEERVGMSIPMAMAGSRNGLRQLAGLNEVIPNGFKMDGDSGVYNAKTRTWEGVMVTNESSGEQESMNIGPEMLIPLTKRYDLAGATKDLIEFGDKRASESRADRGVVVQERNADTNAENAISNRMTARGNEARGRAAEARAAALGDAEIKSQAELATVRIGKLTFPRAGTEITLEDEAKFTGNKEERAAQKARLEAQIAAQTEGFNFFNDLVAGNPKASKNTIADLAKKIASGGKGGVKVESDKDGREFVIFKGQKIYI